MRKCQDHAIHKLHVIKTKWLPVFYKQFIIFYMLQFSLTLCNKTYKFLLTHLLVVRADSYLGDHKVHPQQSFVILSKIFLSLAVLFH